MNSLTFIQIYEIFKLFSQDNQNRFLGGQERFRSTAEAGRFYSGVTFLAAIISYRSASKFEQKIMTVVKEEMDANGAQEMLAPVLHPLDLSAGAQSDEHGRV